MGFFDKKSTVNTTQVTQVNNQSLQAQGPAIMGDGNKIVLTDHKAVKRAMDAIVESTRSNERISGASINAAAQNLSSSLAFADDQAARATEVTLAALDEIAAQNSLTIDTVAASSASAVREIANATRSEAAQLTEKVITYGTIAAAVVALAWILK